MNRKEIERLKDSNIPFEGTEEDWYNQGCMDGLDAADAEPDTTILWHDVSKVPKMDYKVLCIPFFDVITINNKYSWDFYCKIFRVTKWAYVKDLLPKGDRDIFTGYKNI